MKKTYRLFLAAAIAACTGVSDAQAWNAWGWDTGGLATTCLRWDRYSDANNVTYRVYRDNIEVGSNIMRCQFLDTGVTQGTHTYKVQAIKWGSVVEEKTFTVSMGARDFNRPLLSLDVEYEVTFDELMEDGINVTGYSITSAGSSSAGTATKVNGKGWVNHTGNYNISLSGWKNMGRTSDGYNSQFRTYSHWPSSSENDYILDGNRYLWLRDLKRFTIRNDTRLSGDTWASEASYPWAAHGYSWRAADPNNQTIGGYERCWYIAVREPASSISDNLAENQPYTSGKYGVLCVWGPDNAGHRPYGGAPFFLSYDQFYAYYPDRNGANTICEDDFPKPSSNESGWSWSSDNSYGLAMSEDGRSYIHRTGDKYSAETPNKDSHWAIHPITEAGSQHMWSPSRSAKNGYMQSTWFNMSSRTPGRRCDLPNVKGNLQHSGTGYNQPGDQNGAQDYAWLWVVPKYGNSTNAINIRRQRIQNNLVAGYNRINLAGFSALGGLKISQSYIIPMAGYQREDVFVQLKQLDQDIEAIAPLYYIGHNRLKNMPYSPDNVSTAGAAWEQNVTLSDVQAIDLGKDVRTMAGGCTFEFRGQRYLVLPTTRLEGLNRGDFSIYRLDIDDNAGTLNPVPVYDYKAQKDGANQAYRAEYDNQHRVFFKAYSFDNEVQIYSYMPGRQIRMYTLHPYEMGASTPHVGVSPNYRNHPDSYRNAGWNGPSTTWNGVYQDFNAFKATGWWDEPASRGRWDDSWNSWNDTEKDGWYIWKYNVGWYHNGNWVAGDTYKDRNDNRSYTLEDNTLGRENFSLTVQPIYRRRHQGQYEQVLGPQTQAVGNFEYSPVAPQPSVKIYQGSGETEGVYRIDLSFNRVYSSAQNSNGDWYDLHPTRYEVSIGPKGQGQDNGTCWPPVTTQSNYPDINGKALVHVGWNNTGDKGWHSVLTGNSGTWVNIQGDYNFNDWKMTHGQATGTTSESDSQQSVLTFFVKKDEVNWNPMEVTYHVKACYGGDNWSNGDVAKVATGSVTPSYIDLNTTGVDDIAADESSEDAVYYNLQGVRVNPLNLQPGVYVRRTAEGARKVYIN
ncbi:MAG: hypothetical protein Q4F07_02780 [Bacteroidales bacterium]|nr:hypothetical protein [Bacteroidales bacterium]